MAVHSFHSWSPMVFLYGMVGKTDVHWNWSFGMKYMILALYYMATLLCCIWSKLLLYERGHRFKTITHPFTPPTFKNNFIYLLHQFSILCLIFVKFAKYILKIRDFGKFYYVQNMIKMFNIEPYGKVYMSKPLMNIINTCWMVLVWFTFKILSVGHKKLR